MWSTFFYNSLLVGRVVLLSRREYAQIISHRHPTLWKFLPLISNATEYLYTGIPVFRESSYEMAILCKVILSLRNKETTQLHATLSVCKISNRLILTQCDRHWKKWQTIGCGYSRISGFTYRFVNWKLSRKSCT